MVSRTIEFVVNSWRGKLLRRIRNKTRLAHLVDLDSRDQSLVKTLEITRIFLVCRRFQSVFTSVAPSDPSGTVLEDCLRVRQSGAIRVLVALVRMILDLWARASSMWLLGEFGILLFCSPGFWDVGGLLRALSSPGG